MNVCALLADGSYFDATELVRRLQIYIAMKLECLLENRILEDMDMDLISQLSKAIRVEQAKKLSISQSNRLVNEALEKHAEWLKLQDIPQPIVRSSKAILAPRRAPRLSPMAMNTEKPPPRSPRVVPQSPIMKTRKDDPLGDDIFEIDYDSICQLSLGLPQLNGLFAAGSSKEAATTSCSTPVWKSRSITASK